VLYQCFMPDEFKYGLRILRLAPESHDEAFFQYFWEVSASRICGGSDPISRTGSELILSLLYYA
jgi:hypothetical protein